MMKKSVALLLVLFTLLALAVGCSSGAKSTGTKDPLEVDEETKELYKTVVLTIDGNDVTYELYRYYFHELYQYNLDADPDFMKKEGALKELKDEIVEELKRTFAVKELAEKYGVTASEDELKEMDEYIATLKSYMGTSFASTLASRYTSEELFREMLIYEQYIYSGLYEYFASEDCKAFDGSDEAVKEFMKDYNCAVHILLSEKNYSNKENLEKVAALLKDLIDEGRSAEGQITADSSVQDALTALESYLAKYEEARLQMSYIGGLSVYIDRLKAVKSVLSAEGEEAAVKAAIDYLSTTAEAISGETAINDVKNFASNLKGYGVTEKSLTDWSVAYAAYNDLINTEIKNYSENGEAAWPTVAKQDALFAMKLIGAVLKDQGSETMTNTIAFLDEKLSEVFEETALVFGEDRQDPYVGVYFKKGETNDEFEDTFFKLEIGQISAPTYTEFGLHLIMRVEPDLQYFKENMYSGYAGMLVIDDLAATYEVSYGELFETVTPETLK